jgi:hypothetical protein
MVLSFRGGDAAQREPVRRGGAMLPTGQRRHFGGI